MTRTKKKDEINYENEIWRIKMDMISADIEKFLLSADGSGVRFFNWFLNEVCGIFKTSFNPLSISRGMTVSKSDSSRIDGMKDAGLNIWDPVAAVAIKYSDRNLFQGILGEVIYNKLAASEFNLRHQEDDDDTE